MSLLAQSNGGSDKETEGKILTNKSKEKLNLTAQITGLNFGRFTKSMLLSQGQFAAFLNAQANERAELLEELTGTEIYGQISKNVYEEYKQSSQALAHSKAKVEGLALLTDQQQSALKHQLADIANQQLALNQLKETTQTYVDWQQDLKAARQEQIKVYQQQQNANLQWRDSQEQLLRLENNQPAQDLKQQLDKTLALNNQLQTLQQQQVQITEENNKLNGQIETNQSTLTEQIASFEQFKGHREQTEQLIHQQVAPLDEQIKRLNIYIQTHTEQTAHLEKQLTDYANDYHAHQDKVTLCQQQLNQAQRYLQNNSQHEKLIQYLPLWQSQFKALNDTQTAQQQTEIERQNVSEQLASDKNHLQILEYDLQQFYEKLTIAQNAFDAKQKQVDKLLARKGAAGLAEQISQTEQDLVTVGQMQYCQNEYLQLKEQYQQQHHLALEQQSKIQQINGQIEQQLEQRVTMQQQLDDVYHLVQQQKLIISLTDARAKLQPDSPCPLCGSVEHPAIESYQQVNLSDTEQRLAALNGEFDKLNETIHQLQTQKATFEQALNLYGQNIESINAKREPLVENWQNYISKIARDLSIDNQESVNQLYESTEQNLAGLKQNYQDQLNAQQQLNHAQQQLSFDQQNYQQGQFNVEQKNTNITQATIRLNDLTEQLETHRQKLNELNQSLASSMSDIDMSMPTENQQQWLNERQVELDSFIAQQQLASQLQQQVNDLKIAEQQLINQKTQIEVQLQQRQSDVSEQRQQLQQAMDERLECFGEQNIETVRKQLFSQQNQFERKISQLQSVQQEAKEQVQAMLGKLEVLENNINHTEQQYNQAESLFSQQLENSQFESEQALIEALLPEDELKSLEQLKTQLVQHLLESQTLLNRNNQLYFQLGEAQIQVPQYIAEAFNPQNEAVDKPTDEFDFTDVQDQQNLSFMEQTDKLASAEIVANSDFNQQLAWLVKQLEGLIYQQGKLEQQLQADRELRVTAKALLKQIADHQLAHDDWAYLNQLIGSADGNKFRRFAQGLTLDHLVFLANKQLQRLHGRYSLQRKTSEALELLVIDSWQGDVNRDTKTLSGGESFLVSLALALALSDLVSHKTSIDSLFLDEGFGTLDSETLDIALNALDNLNASGKMIGVISHIEAMKERIPVQIQVAKANGLGFSQLADGYRG